MFFPPTDSETFLHLIEADRMPLPPSTVRDVILDSIADGVFTVDEDYRITSFNRAAELITGITLYQGKLANEIVANALGQKLGIDLNQRIES